MKSNAPHPPSRLTRTRDLLRQGKTLEQIRMQLAVSTRTARALVNEVKRTA